MDSSASTPPPAPAMLAALRARATEAGRDEPQALLTFADFMEVALYAPEIGYYRRARPRVGRSADTDFFTSVSIGPLFGELVTAACTQLLPPGRVPGEFTFVEVGAEPGQSVLASVEHPFGAVRTARLTEPAMPAGPCVVFSNELLDAQPFHRVIWREGAWREMGVQIGAAGTLLEVELPQCSQAVEAVRHRLPTAAPERYVIDLPLGSESWVRRCVRSGWWGLFVAFDYGKSWAALCSESPAGTLRSYRAHQLGSDLLAAPGEQDITGHVCWDWIAEALTGEGFTGPSLESQEAFFMHHATSAIEKIVRGPASPEARRSRHSLLQLLHPANMGQKFQVMHAWRDAPGARTG